jgi:hypothetical protein
VGEEGQQVGVGEHVVTPFEIKSLDFKLLERNLAPVVA